MKKLLVSLRVTLRSITTEPGYQMEHVNRTLWGDRR